MSRILVALALVLLAQSALAVRVSNSHKLVRRNTLSFEAVEREESEFPLCPSPDSDDEMECPKRNGICCSFEGRPTGRCCAQGETCTADDPPQCVAYAGMRHLDTLVEKMDTGLNHVDHLDEGELPAILIKKKKVVVEDDEKPASSKSSKSNGSIRDEKLELLREDLLSLEGKAEHDAKYLTQTEYDDVEKELRTLAPPNGSYEPSSDNNSTSSSNTPAETPEEILKREQSEEAERKEKEIEYAKQHENEKDKLEDMIESEVEHDNSKIVDGEIRRQHLWPNRKVVHVVHHTSPAPSSSSSSSSSSHHVVVDHINMVEQRRRVEELKAKIAELEEPLKLQVEPDEAAVHALNYLKARLREMEEEGVHPTDSHKNNAREFLRAIENVKPKSSTTSSDGCNSDGIGDCITTSSSTNDAPVEITSQIRSFLPKGALPSNCLVGVTC